MDTRKYSYYVERLQNIARSPHDVKPRGIVGCIPLKVDCVLVPNEIHDEVWKGFHDWDYEGKYGLNHEKSNVPGFMKITIDRKYEKAIQNG